MASKPLSEQRILDELRDLEPGKWGEVLDFIGYLKQRSAREQGLPHTQILTARDLLQSELVGLWADRQDLDDSVAFARKLRTAQE